MLRVDRQHDEENRRWEGHTAFHASPEEEQLVRAELGAVQAIGQAGGDDSCRAGGGA